VSLISLGVIIKYNVVSGTEGPVIGVVVALVAIVTIGWSIWQSKRESKEMAELEKQFES